MALLDFLKKKLLTKPIRTISGVSPVAIMTAPSKCPHGKCTFCPGGINSPWGNVPQSYTGHEPATMRGLRNNFDPYLQIFNRLEQYVLLGHNFEKIELIIMGGTFPSFPLDYQEEFIKYSFKALNDFSNHFFDKNGELQFLKLKKFFELPALDFHDKDRIKRVQKNILKLKKDSSLEKEQKKNELAKIRCVALCIETRPDYGLLKEGNQMLKLGCTRVELGIQSVYDDILEKICRGHTMKQTKESIRTLKDLGFKVAGHYMPGLPGLNKKKDLAGMYAEAGKNIISNYGSLIACFQDIVNENLDISKELGINEEVAKTLMSVVKESIKPPEIYISAKLIIKNYSSDGVDRIKKVLNSLKDIGKKNEYDFNISYLGAPNYRLKIKSKDYKKANKVLDELMQNYSSLLKEYECEGEVIKL